MHTKFILPSVTNIVPVRNKNRVQDVYSLIGQLRPRTGAHFNKGLHQTMQTQSSHFCRSGSNVARPGCGLFLAALGIALFCHFATAAIAEPVMPINPPLNDVPNSMENGTERAVFAGGCFWGVQAVFQHTKGVTSAVSGYAGGALPGASYEEVSAGDTGHAESVEVTFDPKQISFSRLLQIYFSAVHDPTQMNRQGPDEGTQYRSEIFATNDAQQRIAESCIAELAKARAFPGRIVTKVESLQAFYRAEPYHQDYATLHPGSLYIAVHDLPKRRSWR